MTLKVCYNFWSTGFGPAGNGFNSHTASIGLHLVNLDAMAAHNQGQ
jgi:hypothetical protein